MKTTSKMAKDYAKFLQATLSGAYEKREAPEIKKLSETIEKIGTAWEEFKTTNESRLKAIESGKSTADFDAKLQKIETALSDAESAKSDIEKLLKKAARPNGGGGKDTSETQEQNEYRAAVLDWMRKPTDDLNIRTAQEKAKALQAVDKRAAQVATNVGASGGFALPEVIERQIARLSVDISPIRQLATVRTVGSTDYKELFDLNGANFEWVGETDARAQTTTPNLTEVAPTFGMASARPFATEESLDDLFFDVEDWLIQSSSEAIAKGEGLAFVSGDGLKKPTGFLAGSAPVATADNARAFGTLQFIASGQASAMPTNTDIFIDMIYSLRARYRANAQWVTSRVGLAAMRKYKDTTGQYLWQPSLQSGTPALFSGFGVTEVEDMPIIAANAFPVAFGDFKEGYLITDRVGMRITRDEITSPGMVKFYIRKRVGGKLRNTEAIKLLKISV